jgi:O-antigen ligase
VKAVAAVLALLLLPFCWRKPRYGMILLLGLQVIFLGASLELDPEKFVYGFAFGLLMLAWLPGLWRTRKLWIRHPIAKWLLVVFGVVLLSRVTGAAHGIPAIDWLRDLSPMLNYSWMLLGIYAFGPEVDMRKYARILLAAIVILTVPITLEWMYFRSFLDLHTEIIENRTLGPVITLFGAFLALAFVLDAKDSWTKRKFLAVALGFVISAFLTGTRVAIVAIAVGSFFYFLLVRTEGKTSFRRVLSTVALPLVLAPFLLFFLSATRVVDLGSIAGRFGEAFTSEMLEDETIQDRISETLDAWSAFQGSPIVGQGLGYRTETVYHMGGVGFEPDAFYMHNFYAYLLAKFGITGFMVFVGFLISIVRSATKSYLRMPDGFEKCYVGAMAALMVALMLMSLTAAAFNDRLTTALLGITVGMMIAMNRRETGPGLMAPPLARSA